MYSDAVNNWKAWALVCNQVHEDNTCLEGYNSQVVCNTVESAPKAVQDKTDTVDGAKSDLSKTKFKAHKAW